MKLQLTDIVVDSLLQRRLLISELTKPDVQRADLIYVRTRYLALESSIKSQSATYTKRTNQAKVSS